LPSYCYWFDYCIFLLLLGETVLFYHDWYFVPYRFFKWMPGARDWWVQSPVNDNFLPSDFTVIFHLSTRCLKCSSWKFLFMKFIVFLELLSIFWHLSNREIKKKTILTLAWLKESVFCPVPVIIDIVFLCALVSLLSSCHYIIEAIMLTGCLKELFTSRMSNSSKAAIQFSLSLTFITIAILLFFSVTSAKSVSSISEC